MIENILCPLKKAGAVAFDPKKQMPQLCDHERCAWWNPDYRECIILTIGMGKDRPLPQQETRPEE